MKIQVQYIGSYLKELLTRDCEVRVHSVYRKTINLSFNGRLAALQTYGTPLSPLSMITNASESIFQSLPLKAGEPLRFIPGEMKLLARDSDIIISFGEACFVDTELIPEKTNIPADLKEKLRKILLEDRRSLFSPGLFNTQPKADQNPLFTNYAEKILTEAQAACRIGDLETAASVLQKLLGFGIGLTPSGDDFLSGLLAGLQLQNRKKEPLYLKLTERILENITLTNDISRAFLESAMASHFSTAVLSLQKSLTCSELHDQFAVIGHSSGMDTAAGIYFSLII